LVQAFLIPPSACWPLVLRAGAPAPARPGCFAFPSVKRYFTSFLDKLVNWDFVAANLSKAKWK